MFVARVSDVETMVNIAAEFTMVLRGLPPSQPFFDLVPFGDHVDVDCDYALVCDVLSMIFKHLRDKEENVIAVVLEYLLQAVLTSPPPVRLFSLQYYIYI